MSLLCIECAEYPQPLATHALPGLHCPLQFSLAAFPTLHHINHNGELGGTYGHVSGNLLVR